MMATDFMAVRSGLVWAVFAFGRAAVCPSNVEEIALVSFGQLKKALVFCLRQSGGERYVSAEGSPAGSWTLGFVFYFELLGLRSRESANPRSFKGLF